MSDQLIFLVSAPRSGSTLLQHLLSNNDFVATVNEPWLLLHFCGLQSPELLRAEFDYQQAREATTAFLSSTGQQKAYIRNLGDFLLKTYQPIGKSPETKYILDKTPRYYEILPFIRQVFPEAKIILLKRNPLSVLNSIIDTWKINNISQLYNYHRDLLLAPFLLHEFAHADSDENIITLKYEDLILRPQIEIARLYEWLGIEYQDQVLNFANNKKIHGSYGDKSDLIQKGEVVENPDRWHTKLESKAWRKFVLGYLYYLGPRFMESYGYPLQLEGRRTVAFKTYHYICEKEVLKQLPIKDQLRYLYFRILLYYFSGLRK